MTGGLTFLFTLPYSPSLTHPPSLTQTEGKQLPLSVRQVVHANGSLVVKNVQKGSDDGRYSCSASTNTGERSSQSVQVKVLGKY